MAFFPLVFLSIALQVFQPTWFIFLNFYFPILIHIPLLIKLLILVMFFENSYKIFR